MKTKSIIIVLLSILIVFGANAQTPSQTGMAGEQTEALVPYYKLFSTTNMWIFLKLDTSKGLVKLECLNHA